VTVRALGLKQFVEMTYQEGIINWSGQVYMAYMSGTEIVI